jgi:hypothetical protein
MKNPLPNQFHLKQVKYLRSESAVEVTATYDVNIDGPVAQKGDLKDKRGVEPHLDLVNELNKLKKPLAMQHGLLDVEAVVNAREFHAHANQVEFARRYTEAKIGMVNITGIALFGTEINRGCKIIGTYNGQAINSDNLLFDSAAANVAIGLSEKDLEVICDNIIDETYEYYYNMKVGELKSMFVDEGGELSNDLKNPELQEAG